jgi:hypothetical protein
VLRVGSSGTRHVVLVTNPVIIISEESKGFWSTSSQEESIYIMHLVRL